MERAHMRGCGGCGAFAAEFRDPEENAAAIAEV
jgi:hypothetical protein